MSNDNKETVTNGMFPHFGAEITKDRGRYHQSRLVAISSTGTERVIVSHVCMTDGEFGCMIDEMIAELLALKTRHSIHSATLKRKLESKGKVSNG